MDDGLLWTLAAGALLLGPVAFLMVVRLRRRVRALEDVLQQVLADTRRSAATDGASVQRSAAPPEEPSATPAPQSPLPQSPPPLPVADPSQPVERPQRWAPARPPQIAASVASPPAFGGARLGASFEQTIGTRWTVWVGGLALGLGALLLVRYSIDEGLFGPGVRTLGSLVFAACLVAAGEYLRRREPAWLRASDEAAGTDPRAAYIPGVLTASGTLAAFATIWAAHALYGFIGTTAAFVALGAVGIGTMAAAALHGPALAGLGLAAALATPLLVASNQPDPWPLVVYLAVVSASAQGLARLRGWSWLALAAAVGAALWSGALSTATDGAMASAFFAAGLVHLVVQSALSLWFVAVSPWRDEADETARIDGLTTAVVILFTLAALALLEAGIGAGDYGTLWIVGALVEIALLGGVGLRAAPAAAATAGAAVLALAAVRIWPAEYTSLLLPPGAEILLAWRAPVDPSWFAGFTVVAVGGLAAGAAWRLFAGPALRPSIAALHAGVAALAPLVALAIVYARFTRGGSSLALGSLAAGVALAFVYGARAFRRHPRLAESPALSLGLGALASAAFGALALGFVFVLESGTLTIALSLTALATAWIAWRLELTALRWCVCVFALVVAARFAWEPRIVGPALATTPVLNWLLFGYGTPAVAFLLAARVMARGGEDTPVRVADACGIFFASLLVFFEIRHSVNHGDPFARTSGLVEQGLIALCAFSGSTVLLSLDAARANPVFRVASRIAGVIGSASALFGLAGWANPLFTGQAIEGGAVVNTLLLGYLLPALAAYALTRRARTHGRSRVAAAAACASIGLVFLYVSLEVRRLFHDADIGLSRRTGDAESWSYSAVWLLLGVALLAYGLWRGAREARIASAVFILLTIGKVFLFDLSDLQGILRAASFIGLGGILIGIGLVYQRIVFAPAPPGGAPAPDAAPTSE